MIMAEIKKIQLKIEKERMKTKPPGLGAATHFMRSFFVLGGVLV